jgi:AraC-like DNA-binding protein
MADPPWYQKWMLDPAFRFRLWATPMRGFSLRWHDLVEIAYVRTGRVTASVDGKFHTAGEGDILIINSKTVHGYQRAWPQTELVIVLFGPELFDQSLVDAPNRPFQKPVFERRIHVTRDDEFHAALERLVLAMEREYAGQAEGYRLAIKAKLSEAGLALLRGAPAEAFTAAELGRRLAASQTLERLFAYVHRSFTEPVTLEDAARAASLSKFYFTRFFKEHTGQTFHVYLSRLRVSRAEELLAETSLPVTEVAFVSGFTSLQTFNRVFRAYVGTTPLKYRDGDRPKGQ